MKRSAYVVCWIAIVSLLLTMVGAPLASAQSRMRDKDIESLMKNLKQDAKKFRSAFDQSVGKSAIRKTSQAKDEKALVARFEKDTEGMLNQFKGTKKGDALPTVLSTADQIEKLLAATPMGPETDAAWAKVKTELDTLSQQFNVKAP